jgi:hypothetical protein
MRSELIFEAMSQVPNRFLLAKLLAKAVRGFHKPGFRIQDTTNDVLWRFSRSNPVADLQLANIPSLLPRSNKPARKKAFTSKRSMFPQANLPFTRLLKTVTTRNREPQERQQILGG